MKHRLLIFSLMAGCVFPFVLSATLLFLFPFSVYAQEGPICDSVLSCEAKVNEYQGKIEEIRKKERSLANEISFMEAQVNLTAAKIIEVRSRIAEKAKELESLRSGVEDLEVRLQRVSRLLAFQRDLFSQRAVASYKNDRLSLFEVLFGSTSFSQFVTRYKYLKVLEVQDQKLLKQMEETQKNFTAQKVIVRDKKEKVESVKKSIEKEESDLENYQAALNRQRKEKQLLLNLTKNDEEKFRSLLGQALAEKEALESAILSLELKDGKLVKVGEPIALMGNSGYPRCSTGSHLHLEVRKNGLVVSPADFLSAREADYGEGVSPMSFKGDWAWPLASPVTVSQEFGQSFWAKRGFYGGSPHTGIDMYNNSDPVILAVAEGTLYKGSFSCGGSLLKYVAIDHGQGLFSYYFHVQ